MPQNSSEEALGLRHLVNFIKAETKHRILNENDREARETFRSFLKRIEEYEEAHNLVPV